MLQRLCTSLWKNTVKMRHFLWVKTFADTQHCLKFAAEHLCRSELSRASNSGFNLQQENFAKIMYFYDQNTVTISCGCNFFCETGNGLILHQKSFCEVQKLSYDTVRTETFYIGIHWFVWLEQIRIFAAQIFHEWRNLLCEICENSNWYHFFLGLYNVLQEMSWTHTHTHTASHMIWK